jgi:hypothetical protein
MHSDPDCTVICQQTVPNPLLCLDIWIHDCMGKVPMKCDSHLAQVTEAHTLASRGGTSPLKLIKKVLLARHGGSLKSSPSRLKVPRLVVVG